MEAFYAQLTTLLTLLGGNFLAGLTPLLVIQAARGLFCSEHFVYTRNRIVVFFLVFGGGVLMSTCLLILIPQTRAHYSGYEAARQSPNKDGSSSREEAFPFPEFIVLLGFFCTFAIQELLHHTLNRFHSKQERSSDARVRFCSCAKRHTECSRTFKAAVPDQTLFGLEKKNSALGLEYNEFSRPIEEATNIASNLLVSQGIPNYGSVTNERTNTPVNVMTPPPLITDVVNAVIVQHPSTYTTSNVFLLAVLCCHAAMQGIGIGLLAPQSSWTHVLFVCLQQSVIVFVVGNIGLSSSKELLTSLSFIVVISIMSPTGIGISILIDCELINELALMVLKALVSGSLLYFTFYDLLARQSLKEAPHFSRFVGFTLGAVIVAVLLYGLEVI